MHITDYYLLKLTVLHINILQQLIIAYNYKIYYIWDKFDMVKTR